MNIQYIYNTQLVQIGINKNASYTVVIS